MYKNYNSLHSLLMFELINFNVFMELKKLPWVKILHYNINYQEVYVDGFTFCSILF